MIKEYFCKSLGITLGILAGCGIYFTINDYLNSKVVENTAEEEPTKVEGAN